MIPHIDENGEACIVVGLSKAGRAKAAKVTGSVSLGNKGIKGVEKVREAADGRGEPPKMNMATSIASARQGLSDKRKASDAATIAAGFTPSKTFGGKLSNVRRADLANKVRDARSEATVTTNRSKYDRADRASAAAKKATAAAKKPARQAAAQKGLATRAANKAKSANKTAAARTPANKAAAANKENEASISKLKAKGQVLKKREDQAFARSKKERDTVGRTEKYFRLDVAQGRLASKREDNAKRLKAARQKRQSNSFASDFN